MPLLKTVEVDVSRVAFTLARSDLSTDDAGKPMRYLNKQINAERSKEPTHHEVATAE